MNQKSIQFVVCIHNAECEDLEIRKLYQVLPDASAAQEQYLRIVDESGEDYLYPEDYFAPVEVSSETEQMLVSSD